MLLLDIKTLVSSIAVVLFLLKCSFFISIKRSVGGLTRHRRWSRHRRLVDYLIQKCQMSIFMLVFSHAHNSLNRLVAVQTLDDRVWSQRCGQALHTQLLCVTLRKHVLQPGNVKKGFYLEQELTSTASKSFFCFLITVWKLQRRLLSVV